MFEKKSLSFFGDINKYKEYSEFVNLDDFKVNFNSFMKDNRKLFTKTEESVIRRLFKYSCKVFGVSMIRQDTLATSLGENDTLVEVSTRTIRRALKKAQDNGLIKLYYTYKGFVKRVRSANLCVFQRYYDNLAKYNITEETCKINPNNQNNVHKEEVAESSQTLINQQQENTQLSTNKSNTQSSKKEPLNNRLDGLTLNKGFTTNNVPVNFKHLAGMFFDNAITIENMWNNQKHLFKKYKIVNNAYNHVDIAMDSLRNTVTKHKQNKIHGSFFGYYYKTLERAISESLRKGVLKVQNSFVSNIPFYNWLENY
jgi:hypothetical protein